MPRAQAFAPASAQAVIFTPDGGLAVPRLMRELAPRWTLFDGEPTVLPNLPMPLPGEIPRVTLASADGCWRFDAAASRATMSCQATPTADFPTTLADFFARVATTLLEYRDAFRMRVGRLAAIVISSAASPTPGIDLARHFCAERWWKTQALNRPEAFELHAYKRYDVAGWGTVNSWMRVKSGQLTRGETRTPTIVTEQDVNTLAEDEAQTSYSDERLRAFFASIPAEVASTLGLYFPEGQTE